jgi:NADH-quinone oxidoreductase subunit G
MSERVTITVDGKTLEVDAGTLLIQAAQDNGTYIPRFCWHPRMKPVGMCRMCLVEVEGPRGPALITSCTIPVADGMVVDTKSDTVKKAQEGVLEFLLINHPLDCPVCDRGGECPLQDQTLSHGPGESRFVEEKRHFEKPIAISDLVLLDRERCILCAAARGSPTRSPATRSSSSSTAATTPRSTPSPTSRSPRTSPATRCSCARWGR